MLTSAQRRRLLAIARRALESRVRREPVQQAPDEPFEPASGAFVSIHRHGDLRGCLGRVEGNWPLSDLVEHLGGEVADRDPRFLPVDPRELADIDIEISVLTPAVPVTRVDDIEPGRHGLIVEQGSRRGLLLPQVASEHGWNRQTFLEQTCLKAGLPPDAWKHGARLFMFEAQVFGEGEQREETSP